MAALTDRARFVRVIATAARVDGRSPTTDARSEWMRAWLVVVDERGREDAHGQSSVVVRGQIVLQAGDDAGASDRIEVRSATLGCATWRVTSDPHVVASRQAARALIVTVERIAEPTRDEGWLS